MPGTDLVRATPTELAPTDTDVVVNRCFGGFGLSDAAVRHYLTLAGIPFNEVVSSTWPHVTFYRNDREGEDAYFSHYDIPRDDPALVATVRELGKAANGGIAALAIVTVPGDCKAWHIEEHDGREHVAEDHRTW